MTQSDLGKGLGTDGADVGKQVVYGWEKDQHYPRVDQLMLICRKLGVSSDLLLFGDEVVAHTPQFKAAQAAINTLSDEERLELLTAIMQPGRLDHEVARHLPTAPAHDDLQVFEDAHKLTKPTKKPGKKAA